MQENLVIVESPAKAKTIEKFLGKDFKVMSSYGHIRDLKKKEISIDLDTLEPDYEIPDEKKKVVGELRKSAKLPRKSGSRPMKTAKEKPSAGIFARCWAWTKRRQAASSFMKLLSRLSSKPSSIRDIWT